MIQGKITKHVMT